MNKKTVGCIYCNRRIILEKRKYVLEHNFMTDEPEYICGKCSNGEYHPDGR